MAASVALVVASDRYDDPALRQLRGPSRDAEELARTLSDPAVGGFEVRTMVNQPAHVVAEEMEAFFSGRQRDDLLLLHVSCHGVKDDSGRLYFATTSTKVSRLAATGISSSFVIERMDACRSKKIVLLLDCCYSGAFARGLRPRAGDRIDVEERFDGSGRVVITASTAMEYAFEVSEGTEVSGSGTPSLFTSAVVNGLRTGAADLDGDGRVSVDELYDYVYDEVRARSTSQTPSRTGHVEGRLYLARSPRTGRPALGERTPTEPVRPVRAASLQWRTVAAGLAVAVALAATVDAVLAWLPGGSGSGPQSSASPSPRPTPSLQSTPDPASTATSGQILSQGTVTLQDPLQGLDLHSGELVTFLQSSVAAGPFSDQLFVFDETTSGALPLGEVPFDELGPAELAALAYRSGPDNPSLPRGELPSGSVVAVHVRDGVHAKLQLEQWTADGPRLQWVTYATG